MNKPTHPEIIEKVLVRLIRTEYPSVEGTRIVHIFGKGYSKYHVYVGVSYTDVIRNNYSEFIPYVNNLGKYILPHPDIIKVVGFYTISE
jgi:hypothetical protein